MLDDSPLAIYDSEFGDDDSPTSELIREYSAPACFSPDLFAMVSTTSEDNTDPDTHESDDDTDMDTDTENSHQTTNNKRPPWRWILVGPRRSGTGLHVDPLYTNAWVTVLQGRKRWMLFPPSTPRRLIGIIKDDNNNNGENNVDDRATGPQDVNVSHQTASVVWFQEYYDVVTSAEWPERYRPVEVLQDPGETVFVPNGWPHLVLNLELTVAVTHNYASEWGSSSIDGGDGGGCDQEERGQPLLERIWREVVEKEPEFGRRWYCGMKGKRGDLAERVRKYHEGARKRGELWASYFRLEDCR